MHRLQEMVRLHRKKIGVREIARRLEMSPTTERKYRRALQQAGLLEGAPDKLPPLDRLKDAVTGRMPPQQAPQQTSSIEAFRSDIETMMEAGGGPTAIYDRLRLEDKAFAGSLSAVKRMCLDIKRRWGPRPEEVVIPVETDPGEVAQVDFGCVGRLYDPECGKVRQTYAFVMVLGYSRLMWADVVFDQKVDTWLRLHAEAFDYLGGVPETIVPDNLKAAVTRSFFGLKDKPDLNRSYRELARHYGCMIDPTPPRAPTKKGKVESGVKYVKSNFFGPRQLEELDEARQQLGRWLDEIANRRVHGTTGKVPREVFEATESACLLRLPARRFVPTIWKQATVHPDSHVAFERRLYSVPFVHVGKQVFVRARGNTVDIFAEDKRVATHPRRGPGRITRESHLPEYRRDLRHRSQAWWQKKADEISPVVGAYIRKVFDADDVFNQLRCVQSIVGYLEGFPVERAEAACRRADRFGNYTYQSIKKILVEGLDLQEELPVAVYRLGKLDEPAFARQVSHDKEQDDERN